MHPFEKGIIHNYRLLGVVVTRFYVWDWKNVTKKSDAEMSTKYETFFCGFDMKVEVFDLICYEKESRNL